MMFMSYPPSIQSFSTFSVSCGAGAGGSGASGLSMVRSGVIFMAKPVWSNCQLCMRPGYTSMVWGCSESGRTLNDDYQAHRVGF